MTEANLEDRDILTPLEMQFEKLVKQLPEHLLQGELSAADINVVVEPWDGAWGYYIADHRNRSIFWLERFDIKWIAQRVDGVLSWTDFSESTKINRSQFLTQSTEYWFEHEYWTHRERYPAIREVVKAELLETKAFLVDGLMGRYLEHSKRDCSDDECR